MPSGHYPHKHKPRPIEIPIGPSIAYVPLTRGFYAVIDVEDVYKVAGFPWCEANGYAISCHLGKRLFMHRIVLGHDSIVDHANGSGLDNRKINLRPADKRQNNCNRKIQTNNTSGYKGVSMKRGYKTKKWRATIGLPGRKQKTLGYFETPEEAHDAYCQAAKEMYGEFAHFG